MRVLLISLQNAPPPSLEEQRQWADLGSPLRTARLEEEQTLALTLAMRDGGRLAPMLVCLKNSSLHQRAAALNLPVLPVGGPGAGNPLTLLRLWRWQRRRPHLLVQTVGEEAMALGRRMLRMRPPGATLLAHAFFLRAPRPDMASGKAMRAAHRVLCGTEQVRERVDKALAGEHGADQRRRESASGAEVPSCGGEKGRALPLPGPRACLLPPGMNLEDFPPAPGMRPGESGPRFIFGMTDALTPRSGAQRVTRAMAAIWQRDDLPRWEIRALGGGPRFNELLEEAVGLGVDARLCLLNEQRLPEALEPCHAWLAPGSSPEELPETLWAGFAGGLPVICSKSALHRERLAAAPEAALMVEEHDPQDLARAMMAVMRDADLRRRLAERGAALRGLIGHDAMAGAACRMYEDWSRGLGWLPPVENKNENAGPDRERGSLPCPDHTPDTRKNHEV